MSSATIPEVPSSEPQSAMQRVVNIFLAPSKVFRDLNRDSSWWAAWLLMVVFAVPFVFAMQTRVGFDQIVKNEIAANPKAAEQLDKLSPEQRDRQVELRGTITKYMSYSTPLLILLIFLVIAAILMATFNFGMGAELKFGLAFAVTIWAFMPGILRSLLATISLFAGADPEGFNVNNPVAVNLGFFVSRVDHPVLFSLLSSVDIISIWICILLGIGFASVSKVKRSSSMTAIFSWYILVSLLGVARVAILGQ